MHFCETAVGQENPPINKFMHVRTNWLLQGKQWNDCLVVEGEVLTKGLPAESSWSLVLRSKRLLVKRLSLSPPFFVLLSTWYFHTLYSSKGEQRRNLQQEGSRLHTKRRVLQLLLSEQNQIPCYPNQTIFKCCNC